jgi:DNA-binding transcriptional ArsR family regulator
MHSLRTSWLPTLGQAEVRFAPGAKCMSWELDVSSPFLIRLISKSPVLTVRMAALLATLGHTPKLVVAPLRDHPEIRTLHVYFGVPQQADGVSALQAVRTTCETMGVRIVEHAVKNAFDYTNFLQALSATARKLPNEDLLLNASGGTRVMVMAATIFAFTNDVPLLYYDEYDTQHGVVIPLKAFRNLDRLGETPRAILRRLQKKGPADMSTLAFELEIAASTISVHVQNLQEAGTVLVDREGKRRVVTLVPDLEKVDFGVHS